MASPEIGLARANNLSDIPDPSAARLNLGIETEPFEILRGVQNAGVLPGDFLALQGATSNLQSQINSINAVIGSYLPSGGGTVNGPLVVNGSVRANLFLSPNNTPIATSTDSFWSADGNGGIQYAGSVAIGGNLTVTGSIGFSGELIDLAHPDQAWIGGFTQGIGSGDYILPAAPSESLITDFSQQSLLNQVDQSSVITFARASTGLYTNSAGLLQVAAINEPRYEHDPITGECLGLILEPQTTNICPFSVVTATNWTPERATIANNALADLMGGTAAAKVTIGTTAGTNASIRRATTGITANTIYTVSAYVKPDGFNYIAIGIGSNVGFFHLNNAGEAIPGVNCQAVNIRPYKDGWYRCSATVRTTNTTDNIRLWLCNSNRNTNLLAANFDGISGVFAWGFDCTTRHRPWKHIPTNGTAVTRLADSATTNANAWLSPNKGTLEIETNYRYSAIADPDDLPILTFTGGTFEISRAAQNGWAKITTSGGSVQVGPLPERTRNKILCRFSASSEFSTSTSTKLKTSGTITGLTGFSLGFGVIRRIRYWQESIGSVVSTYKLPDNWANQILTDYEEKNNHAPLTKLARETLLSRLQPGQFLANNYSDRTQADFFFVLEFKGDLVSTPQPIQKAGSTLRWDIDGTIYNQNPLPNHTKGSGDGILLCSAVDIELISGFYIYSNQFSGAAPNWNFPNLSIFYIYSNQFSGAAPNWNFPNLSIFYIYSNQFSGAAPNWNFPNLTLFFIYINQFSGAAPNWNFPNLTQFRIYSNQFSGAAPNWNFPSLTIFFIALNQFSGAAPNWNFPNLTQFLIYSNQFSGAAPNWNFPNLTIFFIALNQFSGAAPNWNFPNLTQFLIYTNQFSGAAPNWNFPSLTQFHIYTNQFTSISGSWVSGTGNLKDAQIQFNNLPQASVDAILQAFFDRRSNLAQQSGNLILDIRNAPPSSTGLTNKTAIEAAFTSGGKTATITVTP